MSALQTFGMVITLVFLFIGAVIGIMMMSDAADRGETWPKYVGSAVVASIFVAAVLAWIGVFG